MQPELRVRDQFHTCVMSAKEASGFSAASSCRLREPTSSEQEGEVLLRSGAKQKLCLELAVMCTGLVGYICWEAAGHPDLDAVAASL